MDGLVIVLIIVGLVFRIANSAKKAQQKSASAPSTQAWPDTDAPAPAKPAMPSADMFAEKPLESAFQVLGGLLDARPRSENPAAGSAPVPAPIPVPVAENIGPGNAAAAAKLRPGIESRLTTIVSAGEGTSATDDAGCLGGSMPHGEHEGDNAPRAERKTASETSFAYAGASRIDALDMRKAIVMSEILRAPVALRGRKSVR